MLHNASAEQGAPKKLLIDQGSGFYTWSGEQTRFQEYLEDQQIEHLVAEPHSPQTQGKVERLIQTIRAELLTRVKFIDEADARERIRAHDRSYNYDRPHQGIGGQRLNALSDDEMLIKQAFFGRRPLRRIAERNRQCVGQSRCSFVRFILRQLSTTRTRMTIVNRWYGGQLIVPWGASASACRGPGLDIFSMTTAVRRGTFVCAAFVWPEATD